MTALLLAGHGTTDRAGADQFRQFAERVGKRLAPDGVPVCGGFIELSRPTLAEAVEELLAAGAQRIAAVPLMLVAAGHTKGDVPGALAREKARHPGLSITYGRPLGPHPGVLALLRERLRAADAGPHTTVLLVGRGSTDPDANAEVAKVARLLAETTNLAGVEYAFVSLAPPGVPAGLDRCQRLGARHVVVLPYFLFTGVLPIRMAVQAGQHDCAEVIGDCDGLAELVVERYREAITGDIRMNCDTCLYRVALPGHEHRIGTPQRPHHHPDDHVH
jgi:sirohydrochlorin cobaltochelatase